MDELFNTDALRFHGLVPAKAWIGAAIAGGTALIGLLANRYQAKKNRELAQFQADANERIIDKQNAYNTPANQMARYQDAGLNPHLVYGQGNPGNQSSSIPYPDTQQVDYTKAFQQFGPLMNQTSLAQSQVQATNAQTRRTGVLTQLNQLQTEVLKQNPLLHGGLEPIITSLKATAESKVANAGMDTLKAEWFSGQATGKDGRALVPGQALMEAELNLLDQRFNLGNLDSKIKAEVIQSKDFQNAILEVQKKFMTEAEITPQHILQFVQLLLMKML